MRPLYGASLSQASAFAEWDLRVKDLSPRKLDGRALHLPFAFEVTSNDELDRIYWHNSAGGAFTAKHPHSLGYVDFSRIGYSLGRDQAVVQMDHMCGLCGGGYYFLLERREDGSWTVTETRMTWIS